MEVALVYFKDDGVRRTFRVKGDRCVLGRKNSCDLQVPIPTVSREHCELTIRNGLVIVRDLGSSNGSYHNSDRIEGEQELAPGDRLSVGPVTFTLQIDGVPEHIEPPLLDAPGASGTGSSMQSGPDESDSGPSPAAGADPDDSDADIADLISKASKAVNDDSSVFDFEIDLDEDDKSRG